MQKKTEEDEQGPRADAGPAAMRAKEEAQRQKNQTDTEEEAWTEEEEALTGLGSACSCAREGRRCTGRRAAYGRLKWQGSGDG